MLKVLPIKTTQINKAEFVRKKLSERYEAEDKKPDAPVNIPHFLRADQKVAEFKANGTLDAEYNELKKGK